MSTPAPTDENPYPPPNAEEPPPPFESAQTFEITKRVNLTQLTDEISSAVNTSVLLALNYGPGVNPGDDPSADNPATLSVSPGNLSKTKIQKAIDGHNPQDGYEVPEAERAFAAVTQKVIDDDDVELSDDELRTAVRGLLRRAAMAPAPDPRRNQLL